MQIVTIILTGVFILAAQFFLSRFTQQRERDTNRLRHRESQIKNVYGPVLSLCTDMLVLSDQRNRAREAVQKKIDDIAAHGQQAPQSLYDRQRDVHEYYYQIDRDNVEKYKEIVKICKDNYYLLESSTKEKLIHVIKHVEAYNFSNKANVPIDLLGRDWFPVELNDFFVDVRATHEKIRKYVVSGDPITIGDLKADEPVLFVAEKAKNLLTDQTGREKPGDKREG